MTTRNTDTPNRRKTAPSVQAATSTLPMGMNRHGETSREQQQQLLVPLPACSATSIVGLSVGIKLFNYFN
jgi:hypothetical protein